MASQRQTKYLLRERLTAQGIDWSTDTLQRTLVGKQLTFMGWLLFDLDRTNEAPNTAPTNPNDWRRTV
jgi:hypothetical protein